MRGTAEAQGLLWDAEVLCPPVALQASSIGPSTLSAVNCSLPTSVDVGHRQIRRPPVTRRGP